MKVTAWNTNKQLETKYHRALTQVERLIMQATAGLKTAEEIMAVLTTVATSEAFKSLSDLVASKFVIQANALEAKSWREAARATNQGKAIYEMLQNSLNGEVRTTMLWKTITNANLITGMPIDLSRALTQHIANETMKGRRAQDIADELHGKLGDYTKAKINLIARTEASKATTALTQARSKDVGVKWYQWRTANDGNRVRDAHRHMQGVLVRWNDPPAPEELIGEKSEGHYHSGDVYNCRCYASPLILLNQITWPAKVYYGGAIRTMSKAQFEKIM